MRALLALTVTAVFALPAVAQQPAAAGTEISKRFISCPIYRDTSNGRKSGCWLATENESGLRFDLQQALTKPQLGREVLVEGAMPAGEPVEGAACGAIVLKPLRVSVLPTACTPLLIPAEGRAGTPFQLPASVMTPNHLPQPQPAPPYVTRDFNILFDHGDDYLLYQHAEVILQEVTRLAKLGDARYVLVMGHAATQPATVSGRTLAEPMALAQARAEMAALALRRLGLPANKIKTSWRGNPPPLRGVAAALADASKRRVTISVQIGPVPTFAMVAPPPATPPVTPLGTGRHRAIMEADPGLPTHTIYRPNDVASMGKETLPIVVFGNGGCANHGSRFRPFLTEIASHGFLVIATGPMGELDSSGAALVSYSPSPAAHSTAALLAEAGVSAEAARRSGLGPAQTLPGQLTQAIDWAIAENERAGSIYKGRIATTQIAVMGQSCGGLQAIAAASGDARVKTLGVWNSGALPDADLARYISGGEATKATVAALRLPTIYVSGEPSDVAFDNTEDDFLRIEQAPLLRAWREQTGHGGTYREPDGGAFGKVAVGWLRWLLKGDEQAGKQFTGSDCGLCVQADWHVKKKLVD